MPKPATESAVEVAAKRSYEYEGDRRGIRYVGWEAEPEKVREEWRASVRVPITAYMTHSGAPVDLREGGVADIQPASTSKHSSQSSDAEAHRDCSDAFRRDSGDPESSASVPNEPTPGPWAYEYIGNLLPGRTRSDRSTIAIVGDFRVVREGRGYDLHSSDEDDARLIAALPELLAFADSVLIYQVEGEHGRVWLRFGGQDVMVAKTSTIGGIALLKMEAVRRSAVSKAKGGRS